MEGHSHVPRPQAGPGAAVRTAGGSTEETANEGANPALPGLRAAEPGGCRASAVTAAPEPGGPKKQETQAASGQETWTLVATPRDRRVGDRLCYLACA